MPGTAALPHLLSIEQLAEHLGVTPRHVRRLVAERRLPFLKVGRFVRFDPTDVAKWLDGARRAPKAFDGLLGRGEAVTGGGYVLRGSLALQAGRRQR